jgi:hypothetical protein
MAARPDQLAYSIDQIRELGGPGRTKTYELIGKGQLKAIKIGNLTRVTGDSVRKLLGECSSTNENTPKQS